MKRLLKIGLVIFLLHALVMAVVYTNQRKFIYYPPKNVPMMEVVEQLGFQHWPERQNYRGLTKTPPAPHSLMVYFHGNASLASSRPDLADSLVEEGFRVLMIEYPGYGHRTGSPSEHRIIADAVESIRLKLGATDLPLYLWGESLGSGVAAGVAYTLQNHSDSIPVEGLILQVPFDSMTNVARHHAGFVPTDRAFKDRYESARRLKEFSGSVAVIVGANDVVVPPELGLNLFESLNTRKKLWLLDDAGHVVPTNRSSPWWEDVINFIRARG